MKYIMSYITLDSELREVCNTHLKAFNKKLNTFSGAYHPEFVTHGWVCWVWLRLSSLSGPHVVQTPRFISILEPARAYTQRTSSQSSKLHRSLMSLVLDGFPVALSTGYGGLSSGLACQAGCQRKTPQEWLGLWQGNQLAVNSKPALDYTSHSWGVLCIRVKS